MDRPTGNLCEGHDLTILQEAQIKIMYAHNNVPKTAGDAKSPAVIFQMPLRYRA